jgi:hypothetical protein
MTRKRRRRLAFDTTLFVAGIGAAAAIGRSGRIADLLDRMGRPVDQRLVFDAALYAALTCLCILGARLLFGFVKRLGDMRTVRLGQLGQVTVEFTLVLPVYILVYGGVVQLGLMANASLMVDYAAFQAARTAIVYYGRPAMDTDPIGAFGAERVLDEDKARLAAAICLTPISPQSRETAQPQFAAVRDALRLALDEDGETWSTTAGRRLDYALANDVIVLTLTTGPPQSGWTTQHIGRFVQNLGVPPAIPEPPTGDPHLDTDLLPLGMIQPPRQIRAVVTYRFKLTIPGVAGIIGTSRNLAGHDALFADITADCDLQATAGRRGTPFHMLGGTPFPPIP